MLIELESNCIEGGMPDVLHVGCGSDIMENAVNVDSKLPGFVGLTGWYPPKNVMVLEGDITSPQDLPKKHFKRIEAHMMLEHVHPDLIPNLLYCFCNFLQDNGALVATVPNFAELAARVIRAADWNSVPNMQSLASFREATNEFLCPTMGAMVGHQSIWVRSVAEVWLNAEGLALVDWQESKNKMHVTFKAVKKGGDHASAIL